MNDRCVRDVQQYQQETAGSALASLGEEPVTQGRQWMAGSALVVISGLLLGLSAARWWRGCLGGFDSPVCVALQNDTHHPIVPAGRWEPIAGTTLPATGALLVLAVALVVMAFALDLEPVGRNWVAATSAAVPAVLGLLTLGALISGRPWPEQLAHFGDLVGVLLAQVDPDGACPGQD